ncbi:MAG TPA: RNA 2',3'-cyclic phosphodiesterase [Acidimicrobiales bacterium]|jgi:2'-5' RNA ligase|nr:RNA 2',3'-cyclic phosphodiesterase [Acidimicrobiales bacterium]
MPRLFVAVWPPDEVLDRIAALPRPEVDGLRWTPREQWHVTLRFLGSVSDVEPLISALAGLKGRAALAHLGPATDRFGHRVLHLPVAGLDALAADVVKATAGHGRPPDGGPPDNRQFHGHLTLARVGRRVTVDLRSLAGVPVAARWPVTGISLVESRADRGGVRYEVLDHFPVVNG